MQVTAGVISVTIPEVSKKQVVTRSGAAQMDWEAVGEAGVWCYQWAAALAGHDHNIQPPANSLDALLVTHSRFCEYSSSVV